MKIKNTFTKIFSACLVAVMFMASICVCADVKFASADTTVNVESAIKYFTVDGDNSNSYLTDLNGAQVLHYMPTNKMEDNTVIAKIKNKLSVKDFAMDFDLSDSVKAVEFTFAVDPSIVTGDAVKAVVKIDNENDTVTVNGASASATTATIEISAQANALAVNGVSVAGVDTDGEVPADIEIKITYTSANPEGGIYFNYIDQKVSDADSKFKQTFTRNTSNTGVLATAKRVLEIDEENTSVKVNGNEIYVYDGVEYTLKVLSYGLDNVTLSPVLKFAKDAGFVGEYFINSGNRKIAFTAVDFDNADYVEAGEISFGDNGEYATYTVYVVNSDIVNNKTENGVDEDLIKQNAPSYTTDNAIINSFKNAVEKATKAEYEINGETVELDIRVGSGQYFEIPSYESIVISEYSAYSSLVPTVYYVNVDESTEFATTTSMRIPVNTAGTYKFFVIFADEFGNTLEQEDFYDKENFGNETYKDLIFEFTVEDNAPTTVTGAKQVTWYKGVTNTAKSFTIESSSYNAEYKLFFVDANGNEHEIEKYDESKINSYDGTYFTKEEIKAFNYDGTLTFTPQRVGKYIIKCEAQQTNSTKITTGETEITVKEVKTVTPDDHWFENNVWSFVFLGIGTLALAGIIVLLLIKPKEEE
ncbi:MAG: hypothetical protein J6V68_02760 [Clostridia bacterium]|nr:hypothetical protein [Clostridia bacterium]